VTGPVTSRPDPSGTAGAPRASAPGWVATPNVLDAYARVRHVVTDAGDRVHVAWSSATSFTACGRLIARNATDDDRTARRRCRVCFRP
jgi:hypothetical protein